MKRFIVILPFILMLFLQSVFAAFPDVPEDYPEKIAIDWLEEQGVVQGYPDGTYKPDNAVNRVEFLKMLYETVGFEEVNVELPFSDIPEGAWYIPYLKAAYNDGVVEGYPDGTFKPDNKIVFAEAMKIIMNGFYDMNNLPIADVISFNVCAEEYADKYNLEEDINPTDWFYNFIVKADELCLIDFDLNAFDQNGLNPGLVVNRGDMAELLYRAKAVKDNFWDEYLPYTLFMTPFDLDAQKITTDFYSLVIPANWIDNGFNDKWWVYSTEDYSEINVDMQGNATVEQGMKVIITAEELSDRVPEKVEGANISISVTLKDATDIYSSFLGEDGQTQIEQHQILTPNGTFIDIKAYYPNGESEFNLAFAKLMQTFRY